MWRPVALTLTALALVAACAGDDDSTVPSTFAPATSPPLVTLPPELTTTTVRTSDSTMASSSTVEPSVDVAPSTTSADPGSATSSSVVTVTTIDDAPPSTAPGEPDWVAIVQGLYDTLDEINADPSIDRIDDFCVDVQSPCRDVQGAQVEALVRDGWRVVDVPRTIVTNAELTFTADGKPPRDSTLVALEIDTEAPQDGGQIVDSNGDVLFEIAVEPTSGRVITWFVRHMGDDTWRVFEIG